MTHEGQALARAAGLLVGTPFRLNGASAQHGVDCVGLVACTLELIGRESHRPQGYRLRNARIDHHLAFAAINGLGLVHGPLLPGDVVLVEPGPAQHHLLIAQGGGQFVHAHASLGKVVCMPGPLPWPITHHWRLGAPT